MFQYPPHYIQVKVNQDKTTTKSWALRICFTGPLIWIPYNTHFRSWRNSPHWIIYGFCCSNFAPARKNPRTSSSWWFFTNPFEKYDGQIGSKSSRSSSKNKKYLRCHQLGGCFIGIPTIRYNKPYNQGHLVIPWPPPWDLFIEQKLWDLGLKRQTRHTWMSTIRPSAGRPGNHGNPNGFRHPCTAWDVQPCLWWDKLHKLHINWYRISSINSS